MSKDYCALQSALNFPRVEFVLKDGSRVKGVVIGWFKGNSQNDEPLITGWHIVKPEESATLGWDLFGFRAGQIVDSAEIVEAHFSE